MRSPQPVVRLGQPLYRAAGMASLTPLARLLVTRLSWLFATGDQRDAEILALRHQVLVLQRQVNRPRFTDTDRTILAMPASALDRRRLAQVFLVAKPATAIDWHHHLVARHWTQPPARKPGRPPIDSDLRRLVVRLADENPTWGYRRVHGELHSLGHQVAASTLWKILRAAAIDPVQDRTGPTWWSSSARKRRASSPPTSHASTPRCSGGCTSCS